MLRVMTARLVMLGVVATGALFAPAAHADQGIDKGTWDSGAAIGSCDAGINTRTCTYDVYFTNCQEASVATGGPRLLVPCDVDFDGTVGVQPRVNAAGRVIGCTSVVDTYTGSVTFTSGLLGNFSRTIPLTDLTVQSAHPDQSTAAVHFTASVTSGLNNWVVNGALTATCAPSKNSSNSLTAGSVTVSAV
jgi:hypothetical protein